MPLLAAVAGPLLIIALVLVLLHDVAFGGRLSDFNPDFLSVWVPNECFLGEHLRKGSIAHWNPYSFAGAPFAADPQSGWIYLPMMIFGLLPCGKAAAALMLFGPIAAGLGAYAFLRAEGVSRAAGTVAGLSLAGLCAGTSLVVTITFVGFLAWTPIMLAAASKVFSGGTWKGRFFWSGLTAIAWGQVASAHASNGLFMGSVLLLLFLAYRAIRALRERSMSLKQVVAVALLLATALPLVNLAYFLPRLMYLEGTTLSYGYEGIKEIRNELWEIEPDEKSITGRDTSEMTWIFRVVTSPGAHLGAVALALSFAALFSRRYRIMTALLLCYSLFFHLIGTRQVAEAAGSFAETSVGQLYVHSPGRFVFAELLGLCLLAGIGTEAWLRETSWRYRVLMVIPGVLVWGAGALIAGAIPARMTLIALSALVTVAATAMGAYRPVFLGLVPIVLAVELAANGLGGQGESLQPVGNGLPEMPIIRAMPEPQVDLDKIMSTPPSLEGLTGLQTSRWLKFEPRLAELGQSRLQRIQEVQGYNPVQLIRFWIHSRAFEPKAAPHSFRVTEYTKISPQLLDLLQVGYVEAPGDADVVDPAWEEFGRRGKRSLFRLPQAPPKASVLRSWEVLGSPGSVLDAVISSDFRPSRKVILEEEPSIVPTKGSFEDNVEINWPDVQTVEIRADLEEAGLLLVRIPYDRYWTATIDGAETDISPANYFLQAVEVPAGSHLVRLVYNDPWIKRGLWGSLVVILLLVLIPQAGARFGEVRRSRRTRRGATQEEPREVSGNPTEGGQG